MVAIFPFVPEEITVHLGAPDEDAPNVRVPYLYYLQNAAASEIYPTWELSAIRANILAINSYALNRIYTQYYPTRGYDFDITNTTAYDQAFVDGRSTFENIDRIAQELVSTYIRRQGNIEPLAAKFCNGTTSTCEGLSQWGSEELAMAGKNSVEILKTYYGDDIELVSNAATAPITPSYPGTPLSLGSRGDDVSLLQAVLNRISQNYPAIPKINPVDGVFAESTENAVRAYQRIFNLDVDGVVGEQTWNSLARVFVAVKDLAELQSEGLTFAAITSAFPGFLQTGDESASVANVQYMLGVVSAFNSEIPEPDRHGVYDEATEEAVAAYQQCQNLPQTGSVDEKTWDALYDSYAAIDRGVFRDASLFRFPPMPAADTPAQMHAQLSAVAAAFPSVAPPGKTNAQMQRSIADFQRVCGLTPTGHADKKTLASLASICDDLRYADCTHPRQFCGKNLYYGCRDTVPPAEAHMNPRLADADQPVRNLQQMLHDLHAQPSVTPDGYYDKRTEAAVFAFQKAHDLPATGIVDYATWCALCAAAPPQAEIPFHGKP